MRPFSIDLRERIVAAYENQEGSYAVLAARFSVSRAVVGKFVRQQREQGTLASGSIDGDARRQFVALRKQRCGDTSVPVPTPHSPNESRRWGSTVR